MRVLEIEETDVFFLVASFEMLSFFCKQSFFQASIWNFKLLGLIFEEIRILGSNNYKVDFFQSLGIEFQETLNYKMTITRV